MLHTIELSDSIRQNYAEASLTAFFELCDRKDYDAAMLAMLGRLGYTGLDGALFDPSKYAVIIPDGDGVITIPPKDERIPVVTLAPSESVLVTDETTAAAYPTNATSGDALASVFHPRLITELDDETCQVTELLSRPLVIFNYAPYSFTAAGRVGRTMVGHELAHVTQCMERRTHTFAKNGLSRQIGLQRLSRELEAYGAQITMEDESLEYDPAEDTLDMAFAVEKHRAKYLGDSYVATDAFVSLTLQAPMVKDIIPTELHLA